jgi:hypothetical protein
MVNKSKLITGKCSISEKVIQGWGDMKNRLVSCLFILVAFFLVAGCATQTYEPDQKAVGKDATVKKLGPTEQKEQAYEIFKEILVLSDSPDRQRNLPEIKQRYREIINKYPDVGLAQESYLRLVLLAKEEKNESGNKEAEQLYQEFLQKYPDSKLKKVIASEVRAR